VNEFTKFFLQCGTEGPLFAFVTVTDVKGVGLRLPGDYFDHSSARYRRDQLLLHRMISDEQRDQDAPVLFRPLFDILANAFGLPYSLSYGPDGSYKIPYRR
jgi:hypothetical protein